MKVKLLISVILASLTIGTAQAWESIAPEVGELTEDGTQMNVRVIAHAKLGQLEAMKEALAAHGATFHVEGKDWVAVTVGVRADNFRELISIASVKHVEKDQQRQAIPVDLDPLSAEELVNTATAALPLFRWVGDEAVPYGIDAIQAFGFKSNLATMPRVCIIDSGYALGHPDLPTQVSGTDQGAGPWSSDDIDHGTHVAGTIAALGGNVIYPGFNGIVGVIPEGADLFIVRAFDGSGRFIYASDLAGAIMDCAKAGAKVVNMSLGGVVKTEAEEEALEDLEEMGILMVAAAGNGGSAIHLYPASYDSVISVAASDNSNNRALFSQRTAQVELSGPGVRVLSTLPFNAFAYGSGTSMATPHVAGAAATVWSHFPECEAEDIREALSASALDLGAPGYDYETGHGLVQVQAAYDYLMDEGC